KAVPPNLLVAGKHWAGLQPTHKAPASVVDAERYRSASIKSERDGRPAARGIRPNPKAKGLAVLIENRRCGGRRDVSGPANRVWVTQRGPIEAHSHNPALGEFDSSGPRAVSNKLAPYSYPAKSA